MKRGDVIQKEIIVKEGEALGHGFTTHVKAEQFGKSLNQPYKVLPDELNQSRLMVVASTEFIKYEKAKVNWVVGDEAAITFNNGFAKIINIREEPEWKVIVEAAPSYQSTVAQMSDDELRASIEALREQRKVIPKAKKSVKGISVDRKDPIALALAKLPPDKKHALMKKLGMIE